MKTRILQLTSLTMLFLLLAGSCDRDNENGEFTPVDFKKFSDFGCENILWHPKPGFAGNHYVVTTQQELEKYINSDCIPQIDFSEYIVLLGSKTFTSGAHFIDEKVEENNEEIVYTVTFLKGITTIAIGVPYHVVIKKLSIEKEIRIVEIVKTKI